MRSRRPKPESLLFLAACAAVLLAIFAAPVRAQDAALPLDAYWRLLASVREKLASGDIAVADREELAAEIEAIRWVELVDGTLVPVDPAFLAARLRTGAEMDALRALFDAILAQQRSWPQQDFGGQELQALERILQQPQFQWAVEPPNPLVEIYQRALRWLLELLARFLPIGAPALPVLNGLLTAGLGLLLLLILVFIYRSTLRGLVREAEIDQARARQPGMTIDQALQTAHALARDGDYRSGVRFLYLAALLTLEERGFVRHDRSRTNHEFLADLSSRPDLAAPLERVVEVFDQVWYGFRPIDAAEFQGFAETVEEIHRRRA